MRTLENIVVAFTAISGHNGVPHLHVATLQHIRCPFISAWWRFLLGGFLRIFAFTPTYGARSAARDVARGGRALVTQSHNIFARALGYSM